MKLSVITINYNNATGLERTIKSIINQSPKNFEYIIIDGLSTDRSSEVINLYKEKIDHIIIEKDTGIYNAMNKGIQIASGEYILFINSGDELYNDQTLKNCYSFLHTYDFLSGNTLCISPKGKRKMWKSPQILTSYLLMRYSLSHQSTFIRAKLLKDRPYKEDLRIVSDWEQMIFELLINDASYSYINQTISIFYEDGISRNNKNLNEKERKQVLNNYFSERIQKDILGRTKLNEIINHVPPYSKLYTYILISIRLIRKVYNILYAPKKQY